MAADGHAHAFVRALGAKLVRAKRFVAGEAAMAKIACYFITKVVPAAVLALSAQLSPHPAAAQGEPILVYNAQHANLTEAWAKGFTSETGIKAIIRNGGDSELGNQIVQEGGASPADVFLTENSPAMTLVENAGLFAPLDAATLAQVPEAYRPSTGKWVGIAARATIFVYNKNKLQQS